MDPRDIFDGLVFALIVTLCFVATWQLLERISSMDSETIIIYDYPIFWPPYATDYARDDEIIILEYEDNPYYTEYEDIIIEDDD